MDLLLLTMYQSPMILISYFNTEEINKNLHRKSKKQIDTKKLFPQNIILYGDSSFILCPETRRCIGQYYEIVKYAIKGYLLKKNVDGLDLKKLILINGYSQNIGS